MLDDLHTIDWAALEEASGSAAGIPDALRMLASASPEERQAGYWRIDNHVVVQSDLFPVAPFVVPFLLEMLACEARPGAGLIYDLLYEIGGGAAPDCEATVFRLPGWEERAWTLQEACHEVVKSGIDLYLQDVVHADPAVQRHAVALIVMLAERDPSFRPRLQAAIDGLDSPDIQAALRGIE